MPYILRDDQGKISRASIKALMGGEMLPHNHPEIVAFLTERGQKPEHIEQAINDLRRTDAEMARTVEDVIMVLMKKNLIRMTDMPKMTQDRLSERVKLRILIEEIYDQASGSK